jgi:hypothetical protein
MQEMQSLPESIQNVQRVLEPYIKPRQEVSKVRRILALHHGEAISISQPLSLLEASCSIGATSSGIRGLRKEYLKCARASVKARQEYQHLSREHRLHNTSESQQYGRRLQSHSQAHDDPEVSLVSFLETVECRRKHARLRILQDYVDVLALKPAASTDYLNTNVVLKDFDALSPVPPDLMVAKSVHSKSTGTDLNELMQQLEKSVLRAKMILKREQKLLAQVKTRNPPQNDIYSSGSRLQALGTARNELIKWIESELVTAGDGSAEADDDQDIHKNESKGRTYINSQLSAIQEQYLQYTKARQALIAATTGILEAAPLAAIASEQEPRSLNDEMDLFDSESHIIHPYIEKLSSVSNEQKSMIQQKSHLTTSLAKHLKEASRSLDRLAEESHLLPSFSPAIPNSRLSILESSMAFEDKISNYEKPNTTIRARSWVSASEAASKATKDALAESVVEGELSLMEAQNTLLQLQELLGDDFDSERGDGTSKSDVWAILDGNLGAIGEGKANDV